MRYGKALVVGLVVASVLLSACAAGEPTPGVSERHVAEEESLVEAPVEEGEARGDTPADGEEAYAEAPADERGYDETWSASSEDAPSGAGEMEEPALKGDTDVDSYDGEADSGRDIQATPAAVRQIEIREIEALKAGQSDDNLRFDAFQAFIGDVYPRHLDLIEDRVVIRVERPDGSPVHGAVVALEGQRGIELRTGSDGKVYLFPELYGVESPIRAEVRCPEAGFAQEGSDALPEQGQYGEELTVEMGCRRPEQVLLDVVYLHDVTGSMHDEMAQLQATTERVMAMLEETYGQSQGMIRVGGVLYRDRGDAFVTRVIRFDTPRGFSERFRQFRADGGGDKPESVNAGLEDALWMDWREEAIKVIVLVGDAAPHDYRDDPWERYLDLSQRAVEQGIRLHTISASGMRDRGELAWREMAVVTGGKFVFLTYESAAEDEPGGETTRHVEGYNVDDLGSIVFSLLKEEIDNQR